MSATSTPLRLVCLTLALVLALVSAPCMGATVDDSSNTGVQATDSDDDDDYGEEIVFGLFVAIIAALVWVGFKSDLEWWGHKDDPEPVPVVAESRPEFFIDLNPMDDYAGPSLETEAEYEFAGRAGVMVRF